MNADECDVKTDRLKVVSQHTKLTTERCFRGWAVNKHNQEQSWRGVVVAVSLNDVSVGGL